MPLEPLKFEVREDLVALGYFIELSEQHIFENPGAASLDKAGSPQKLMDKQEFPLQYPGVFSSKSICGALLRKKYPEELRAPKTDNPAY